MRSFEQSDDRRKQSRSSRSWVLIWCCLAAWGCEATTKKHPIGGNGDGGDAASTSTSPMCAVPAFPPMPICAGTCGNGLRDSCLSCAPQILTSGGSGGTDGSARPGCAEGTTPETLTEACDGTDVGVASCVSLGFSSGTLGCTSFCSYDTNACDSCVANAHTLACRRTELIANSPSSLALTASDEEIAVAWVAGPGLLGHEPVLGSARLARFAPDLSLISQSNCFGPAHAHNIALARSRSGYIIAIDDDGDTGVSIQSFDTSGNAVGSPRVLPGASYPALVERAINGVVSGGPLLVWSEAPSSGSTASGLPMRAELLGDDGTAETGPTLLTAAVPVGHTNGVFIGQEFLVGTESGGARFVALDGTITTPPISATVGEDPGIAWSGMAGAVVSFGATWQGFDASGSAIGAPVNLSKQIFIPSTIAMLGSDSIVAFGSGDTTTIDQTARSASVGSPPTELPLLRRSESSLTPRPWGNRSWLGAAPKSFSPG
jgi:hypothetical protein